MKTEQFKALESLIGILSQELGGPINITYPIIQDGYGLAVYDSYGNLLNP